jgi:hypothetical protein
MEITAEPKTLPITVRLSPDRVRMLELVASIETREREVEVSRTKLMREFIEDGLIVWMKTHPDNEEIRILKESYNVEP